MLGAKYYLDNPDTNIFVGDCREVLRNISKESVDLIFADPPFNWDVPYEEWHDGMPREDYLRFTYEWLDACLGVLSERGAFWVNIPDDTAAEIVVHLKQRGLTMVNWCIWHFRFGQHRDTNFITSKVHALYMARDWKNRTWNPEAIMEPSDRAAVYNDPRTRETRRPGLRVPLDVWYGPYWGRIQGNNAERRALHRNQIPEAYLERVIRCCSNAGDLVLDPFLGSGTTLTVARELGRRSIGVEYSEEYADSAYQRVLQGPVRLSRPSTTNAFTFSRRRTTDTSQLELDFSESTPNEGKQTEP